MVRTYSYQLLKKIRAMLLKQFPEEAETFAFQITEHFSGLSRTQILVDEPFITGPQFESQIQAIVDRLIDNEPIQYILGKAHFFGRLFDVNRSTLIPRQETEELVHLVIEDLKEKTKLWILDIGTGTGCIPITIQLESNSHKVEGVDISKQAVETAKTNAQQLGAKVSFYVLDILEENLPNSYDVIISNPPYVLDREKALMKQNVINHEPHYALFVPDENPLLFYKRITELATNSLKPGGRLYFEINEQFGNEVVELLKYNTFQHVVLHRDLSRKDRFVSGVWV